MLKGILETNFYKKDASSEIKLITGGETMKFQGVTIHKNTKCDTWYARYRKNGKQIYISAKTQKDCYDKLKSEILRNQKAELKKLKQSDKQPKENSITLSEWYSKWLKLYKSDVRKSTLKQYQIDFKHLGKLVEMPINKIKCSDMIEQLNTIAGNRAKQLTYEFAKMLFDKAFINELVQKNIMLLIDKPKHTKTNGNALLPEDEKILEHKLIEDKSDMFLICLYQGLRKGEMLALKGEDIDLVNNTLSINESIDFENKVSDTKNSSSKRIMPIFEKSKQILSKYADVKGRIFPFSVQKAERLFQNYSINFKTRYTIHSLRHTFITKCQEAEIPLYIIQKWVGHVKGSSVTASVYTHIRSSAEAENISKINGLR